MENENETVVENSTTENIWNENSYDPLAPSEDWDFLI